MMIMAKALFILFLMMDINGHGLKTDGGTLRTPDGTYSYFHITDCQIIVNDDGSTTAQGGYKGRCYVPAGPEYTLTDAEVEEAVFRQLLNSANDIPKFN